MSEVLHESRGGVFRITINRPQRYNARISCPQNCSSYEFSSARRHSCAALKSR